MLTNKLNLFLDMDGVIIDSLPAACTVYNILYQHHPNFKPAVWYKCTRWDMKDIAPLYNNINELFSHKLFFELVQFMNPNTKDIIEQLCQQYNVHVVTIGCPTNLAYKALWLQNNLPCIKNYILINNELGNVNKSVVNMQDGILIDDNVQNLINSNAKYKYIFGDEYPWNTGYNYHRLFNWTDVKGLLLS